MSVAVAGSQLQARRVTASKPTAAAAPTTSPESLSPTVRCASATLLPAITFMPTETFADAVKSQRIFVGHIVPRSYTRRLR